MNGLNYFCIICSHLFTNSDPPPEWMVKNICIFLLTSLGSHIESTVNDARIRGFSWTAEPLTLVPDQSSFSRRRPLVFQRGQREVRWFLTALFKLYFSPDKRSW